MEECDERESQVRVAVRRAAKLRASFALMNSNDGICSLRARRWPIFGDKAVIVGMGREEIESAPASIEGRARSPNGGEKIEAAPAAEQREKVRSCAKSVW